MVINSNQILNKGYNSNIVANKIFYQDSQVDGIHDRYVVYVQDGTKHIDFYENGIVPQVAYSGNTGITDVEFNNIKATSIGAFSGCTNLKTIVANGDISISYNSFLDCDSLSSVTFNGNVGNIGTSSFSGDTQIKNVTFNKNVGKIWNYAFYNCNSLSSLTFNENVGEIGERAFGGIYNLSSVTFNGTLQTIGDYAFDNCSNLSGFTCPSGLTTIGSHAFNGCGKIANLAFNDELQTIGDYAFYDAKVSDITIPNSVTGIGANAFGNEVTVANLGNTRTSMPSIGGPASFGCYAKVVIPDSLYLSTREISPWSTIYGEDRLIRYSTYIDPYVYKWIGDDMTQEEMTTNGTIPFAKYRGDTTLTKVVFGDGINIVKEAAFSGCTSLSSITLNEGLEEIGSFSGDNVAYGGVFADCTSLSSITIPNSVTRIASATCSGCTTLKDVTIGSGLRMITDYSFYSCTSLSSVTLSEGNNNIRPHAFNSCHRLTEITMPNSIKYLQPYCFYNCSRLAVINFGNTRTDMVILSNSNAFTGLPNNYKIEHVESYPITFLSNDKKFIKRKVEDSVIKSHIIIENYITEFCYNNRWIAVKRVDIPEQVIQSRNLKNVNLDDVEYYLLDTYNNKLKSHMNEEEFKNYIKEKEIKDLCEWIPTFPANPIGSRGID